MSTAIKIFQNEPLIKHFNTGETIIEAGTLGDYMYGIQHGEVEVVHQGRVLYSVGVGGVVGEMALIDATSPRSASVVAKTDCIVAAIDRKRFLILVQTTPYFALDVMKIMAERLRMTTQLL